MIKYIFVDTAAFIALANKADQYHAPATKRLTHILKDSSTILLTTTYVFAETVTRIQRKISTEKALEIGNSIRKEPRIDILNPLDDVIDSAWEIYLKYYDQRFSFVDCISFATMHQLNIKKVFTFDNHFSIMKFELI